MVVEIDFDPVFEAAYQRWLQENIRISKGEHKKRLSQGLGYSEKTFLARIWWPAFGTFQHLYPEFEVRDFKDGVRFLDFSYIHNGLRLCIEIDTFRTHLRDLDHWQYDDHLERQNDLMIDEWKILRFSLNKIKQNPRHCQQKLQQALGKWGANQNPAGLEDPIDQAIIRLLLLRGTPLSPIEVSRELGWSNTTTAKHLKRLSEEQYVIPARSNPKRATRYLFNRNRRGPGERKKRAD